MSLPPPPPMGVTPIVVATRPASSAQQNGHALPISCYIDAESSKQIVDDVFGFLNDEPDVSGPLGPNVKEKSLMFERELRLRKDVPTKLLSRPVNYYEAAPRKIINQTRL
ncbi:maker451 [Drosophila busckii]|uniref:Maker451 n=1 Tax=Drosophila busckii TaxID=30019 RepID=A0A0M4EQD7_DROBS|nr:maker451 [Drosophila busckii]